MRFDRMRAWILAVLIAVFAVVLPAAAEEYDLVIVGGRVMDPESGLDAVRNVGVSDGKIVAVTQDAITGKQTIDAKGHVVAPGFIDGHVHVVDSPIAQKGLVRDGVTTALDLEVGAYPVDTWYDNLKGRSQVNYGTNVSVAAARVAAFNPDFEKQRGKFKSKTGNLVEGLFGGMPIGSDWVTRVATDSTLR